jgi:hypothetical protein
MTAIELEWMEYDIIHNNRDKSPEEIESMLDGLYGKVAR